MPPQPGRKERNFKSQAALALAFNASRWKTEAGALLGVHGQPEVPNCLKNYTPLDPGKRGLKFLWAWWCGSFLNVPPGHQAKSNCIRNYLGRYLLKIHFPPYKVVWSGFPSSGPSQILPTHPNPHPSFSSLSLENRHIIKNQRIADIGTHIHRDPIKTRSWKPQYTTKRQKCRQNLRERPLKPQFLLCDLLLKCGLYASKTPAEKTNCSFVSDYQLEMASGVGTEQMSTSP